MAAYPIYQPQYGIYNPNNFSKQPSANDALTVDTAKLYFLQFPNAQTTQTEYLHSIGVGSDATFNGTVTFNDTVTYNTDIEFTADVLVDGMATVMDNLLCESTATITDILTCEGGIDISIVGKGLTFPDNTTQTTAFIEANYAQLNTANTFLSPYVQSIAGSLNIGNDTTPSIDYTSIAQGGGTLGINNLSTTSPSMSFGLKNGSVLKSYFNIQPSGCNLETGLNMNNNTITGGIYNGTQLNGTSLSCTGGGSATNFNYYSTNAFSINMGLSDTLFILNAGNNVMAMSPSLITAYKDISMNSNDITNCVSINAPTGTFVTSATPLTTDNSTKIATTAFVKNAISSGGAAYALLTAPAGALQTFTTPINFSSTLQLGSVNVATVNNLPQATSSFLQPWTLSPISGLVTLNSGAAQEVIQQSTSSSAYAYFVSNPVAFQFNTLGTPSLYDIIGQFQFSTAATGGTLILPWANFPPPGGNYWVTVQVNSVSNGINTSITQRWPVSFGNAGGYGVINILAYYNMGNNTTNFYDFSTLGLLPP